MRRRETEMIQRRAAGGGRTDGQLSPRSTCHPLLGHCRVTCDTWNRKTVRSPSTSGRCCRERRWMASRGRVVGKSAYAQSRRRVDDNVDVHLELELSIHRFQFNTSPMSPISYHLLNSLATSRGPSSPGRLTCVRVMSHQQAFNQFMAGGRSGIASVFISPFSRFPERRTLARAQHNCTRAPRRASPDSSSRFLARRTPRDDDTMSQMVRRGLSAGRVASPRNPSLSPAVATTRAIPRGRGSRARLTGRIPAVSRPSRRMPS